jgi:TetR/AcrR family transcriptional regulator, transcriptional repressor for nem operon
MERERKMETLALMKRSIKGDLTRQRIILKAAQLFNRHGFAGTSMAELMLATGLEKGGIYRHFESKQALAEAAFDYAWDAVTAPRERGMGEAGNSLDKLLLFVENFVGEPPRTVTGGCPLLNTAVDCDDGNALLRSKARAALTGWRTRIADLVRSGQESGEMRGTVDPDSVAVMMISSLEGAVMIGGLEKTRQPLHIVGEHLREYLLGLRVAAKS